MVERITELLRELAYILFAVTAVIAFDLPADPTDYLHWPNKYLGHVHHVTGNQYVERMWIK